MPQISKNDTLAIILGGGRGSRLYPLTKERCKPAVPLGGKYRLIDVPISNCLNSGLRQIYIVSQFMSHSLNQHVAQAYQMDAFNKGFVNIIAAAQTDTGVEDWFQGTADAVRKCAVATHLSRYKRVIILSGDQLYKMNYNEIIQTHEKTGSDITISVLPINRESVESLGIMMTEDDGRITSFIEKPKEEEVVNKYKISDKFIRQKCGDACSLDRHWLASMGIYVFNVPTLLDALKDESLIDFGKDVIPFALSRYKTYAHIFNDYWEDIGTIKSFFEANILLGSRNAPFDFYGSDSTKIFTNQRFLTASRFMGASISESVISDGCYFDEGAAIFRSVIGIRSSVGKASHIDETIIMGNDHYERPEGETHLPPLGVGPAVMIKRAILDKNVSVGAGAKIVNAHAVDYHDGDGYHIRNGIVVIPKGTIIEPGRVI